MFRCCYHLVRLNPCIFGWRSFFHYSLICIFRWRSFFHYSCICIFRWLFGLLKRAWRQNPCIFRWQERSQDGRKRTDYQIPRVLRAEPCRAWRQVYAYLQRTADGRRTHGRRTHARQTADGRTHGTHGTDTRTADGRTHTHGRSGPTTGSFVFYDTICSWTIWRLHIYM